MSDQKMLRLTPKQEAFCAAYMELQNAGAAYRAAYDAAKMTDMSCRVSASRLLSQPNIRQRIAELRAQVAERAVVDTAWVVERAVQVVDRSLEATPVRDRKGKIIDGVWTYDAKATVSALALLAKHVGGFTDRVEHSGNVGVTVERRTPPLDDDDDAGA